MINCFKIAYSIEDLINTYQGAINTYHQAISKLILCTVVKSNIQPTFKIQSDIIMWGKFKKKKTCEYSAIVSNHQVISTKKSL